MSQIILLYFEFVFILKGKKQRSPRIIIIINVEVKQRLLPTLKVSWYCSLPMSLSRKLCPSSDGIIGTHYFPFRWLC